MKDSAGLVATLRMFWSLGFLATAITLALTPGCRGEPNAVFTELSESRRLAADLRVQFHKSADASNRAVMADTDEASIAFAREAEQAKGSSRATSRLGCPSATLGYSDEIRSLGSSGSSLPSTGSSIAACSSWQSRTPTSKPSGCHSVPRVRLRRLPRPARYPSRDHTVQRSLPGRVARCQGHVGRARDPGLAGSPHCRIRRLRDDALREGDGDLGDHGGGRREYAPRTCWNPRARPRVAAAVSALNGFQGISREIVKLSRRNTNVRSLELSLRRKPTMSAACDDTLRVLQDALGKESFTATR